MANPTTKIDPRRAIRRRAFARSFALFPYMLKEVAKSHIWENGPPEKFQDYLPNVLAAHFILRILKTRLTSEIQACQKTGEKPPTALQKFYDDRYTEYKQAICEYFGQDIERVGGAREFMALSIYEGQMSGMIYEAFFTEAAVAGDKFNEAHFWEDVFRGIADNDPDNFFIAMAEKTWLEKMKAYMACFQKSVIMN